MLASWRLWLLVLTPPRSHLEWKTNPVFVAPWCEYNGQFKIIAHPISKVFGSVFDRLEHIKREDEQLQV